MFISHFAKELGLPADHFQSLSERPSPLSPNKKAIQEKKRKDVRSAPLSIAQKQLVDFMVLHPSHFSHLEKNGLRECLAGGIGEVLFLQLKEMVESNTDFEPEELLTRLPEGVERKLVSDLLLRAPLRAMTKSEGETEEEIEDMLAYLRKFRLQKKSGYMIERIRLAESEGDLMKLQELVAENVEISRKMQREAL